MITPVVCGMLVGLLPQIQIQGPQGNLNAGGSVPPPTRVEFPADPGSGKFAPFVDALGQSLAVDAAASGAADFDGDGNRDLWVLGGAGPKAGVLSVQMARGSSLGRFRAWTEYAAGGWVDAATFRSTNYPLGDRVLLVEPSQGTLVSAHYTYPFGGNPQAGLFVLNASWAIGAGAYEIETRDDTGDGHDDIAVLQSPQPGWTRITKLCMDTTMGWLQPERVVTHDLPLPAAGLRLLDFDADGRTDALVSLSGSGVLLLRDDGVKYVPTLLLLMPAAAQDLVVGDADRDGRDDFGLVYPGGVLLVLSTPQRLLPVWLQSPAGVGPLSAARVVGDAQGNLTTVVALPADGQSLVLHPHLAGAAFGAPEVKRPADPAQYQGPGAVGARVFVADLDGDSDEDVVVQLPDRAHWLALPNGEVDLSPRGLYVTDFGLLGETGYRKYGLSMQVPKQTSTVELAVFLEDITLQPTEYVYWGRLQATVPPGAATVSFTIHSQTETSKLKSMIQNGDVYRFPGSITVGGDALISIHLKNGPQRHQSLLIHHEGGEGGNKSALGVKWSVRTAPPKPTMDTDLLPWN